MLTSGLQAFTFWAAAQLVSAQQGSQPLQTATGCGDVGEGNFGGVEGCITLSTTTVQPPQTTGCGDVGEDSFGGVMGCITIPTTTTTANDQPITILPLIGTVTGQDGVLSTVTTIVSWSSSDVAVTATVDGQTQQTTTPVWVCVGDLCNPNCKESDQCDNSGNGGLGPLGLPWPPAPPTPPVLNTPGGGGGGNNGNPTDQPTQTNSETTTEQPSSTTTTNSCVLTQIACTQTCTVSSAAGGPSPTTICTDAQMCRRQAGDGCTSTTGTTTTTSFTTISLEPFICKAGSCACNNVGPQVQNIPPAITTNDPGDKVPSITDVPKQPVKRSSRVTRVDKIIKRVNEVDPTVIRQTDFTNPNTFLTKGKVQWFKHAVTLVERDGPVNEERESVGIASSTWFDYSDLRNHAITTGSGPSWGCTSVLVFSERGVWIAHFWEKEQILNDATFNNDVINFIRVGSGDGRYQGVVDVVDRLFKGPKPGNEEGEIVEEPVFAFAVIFTPSYRERQDVPQGKSATDPIYSDQLEKIKRVLVNQLPGFTAANRDQKIQIATYKPVEFEADMDAQPWRGLLTFEYVPRHLRRDKDGQCIVARAIRIWNQDVTVGVFPYSWPNQPAAAGPSKSKLKRLDKGACPANFADILRSQGNGASEPQDLYDVNAPTSGSGAGGSSQELPPPTVTSAAATTTTAQPPPPPPPTTTMQPPPPPPPTTTRQPPPPPPPTTTKQPPPPPPPTTTRQPPPPPPPTTTRQPPPPPPPTTTKQPPPAATDMCSQWSFGPNGVQVGSNCDGDPHKTVTVTVPVGTLRAKRAITTTF